jgi:glutaredoxin 3
MPKQIKMYSTRYCPYCMGARSLLESKNLGYEDVGVDGNPELRREMIERSGRHTVPQIWIGDHHIGGFDELNSLERRGQLDELIKAA